MDRTQTTSRAPRTFWAKTFNAVLDRSRRWLGIGVYGIYTRPLAPPQHSEPDMPDFAHRIYEQRDAEALLAQAKRPELEMSETFVRRALAKGDACGAILYKNEIVSYGWLAFSPTHHSEGVYVDFGENDRYGYKGLTLQEFRGRHLRRLFNHFNDPYCMARGRTHVIAFVDLGNNASIRHMTAMGQRRIGFAGFLKRGRLFIPFATAAVRRHGFRFCVPRGAPAETN